jgi:hypothetical protein
VATSKVWIGFAVVGIATGAEPAAAQEVKVSGPLREAIQASSSSNPGSRRAEEFLLPSGQLEVGGELVFLMSDGGRPRPELKLTDVGLLRLRARRALGDWVEVFVGSEFLVKQPDTWDEPVWQSAFAGVLVPFGHRLAMSLQGGGGTLFGEDGSWWQVQPSLLAKPVVSRYVRFELALGYSATLLDIEQDRRPFWLEEMVLHAETQIGGDDAAAWVGFDYSLPVASGPDNATSASHRFLDPSVGLGLHIGGVMTPRRSNWDLFAIYSFVDRGNLENPATTLPILDGGFDQRQLAIGVRHRFGAKSSNDDW